MAAPMKRNVEIKARILDPELTHLLARDLPGASESVILKQTDIFFRCANGRLKLRQFASGEPSNLIWYDRPDTNDAPKLSSYQIYQTTAPHQLLHVLSVAYGITSRVVKTRELILVGQTRIHLDQVEGLGDFLELEVVLREDQSEEEGRSIAHQLMEKLGIKKEDLLQGAYADLFQRKDVAVPLV